MIHRKALESAALELPWISQQRGLYERTEKTFAEVSSTAGREGIALFSALLRRFLYITDQQYSDAVCEIGEYLAESFDLQNTILCAPTANHEADSGQRFLYDVRTSLGLLGFTQVKTVNRYDHILRSKVDCDDIVLLDEFVGTGRTLIGRAKRIQQQFTDANRNTPNLHFVALAGMAQGLRACDSQFKTSATYYPLKKGVTDHATQHTRKRELEILAVMEDSLAQVVGSTTLPRLGDGGCEALYARSLGNCPNSTLPTFWWPVFGTCTVRSPMFPRVT